MSGRAGGNRVESRNSTGPLEHFAQRHRLRIIRDDCGDPIVRGTHGDIGDYGDGTLLIAAFWGQGPFSRTRAQRIRRAVTGSYAECKAGGPDGDEATFTFDPADERAGQFFISALKIKTKRKTTPAMLANLAQMRARARTKRSSLARPLQIGEEANQISAGLQTPGDKL